MHHITVLIGQYLHFDVAGPMDELFRKYGVVAEGGCGFAARAFQGICQHLGRIHSTHAATAAAARCFEHDGIANRLGECLGGLVVCNRLVAPRHHGNIQRARQLSCFHLVAEQCHRRR